MTSGGFSPTGPQRWLCTIRGDMAKKRFSEIERCGYCGRYAAKEYPRPVIDHDYLWAYVRVLPSRVCQECHDYFDEKYRDIETYKCVICGQKHRVKERKKIRGFTEGYPIRAQVYFETCHCFDCLAAYKHKSELPFKLAAMKKDHKAFKAALTELRKTIKGE